ncbi:beta-ketoacyl synthase N-terminal-like domain-containing protein, partial [Streptomyces sp. 2MCAF27]
MLNGTMDRTPSTVITAWSTVSPFGVGREAFEQGLLTGQGAARRPATSDWGVVADTQAQLVPEFRVRDVLGKRGTRGLDRVAALTITAVRELLRDAPDIVADEGLAAALVLGTTAGSAQTYADVIRASFEGRRPQNIPALAIPNLAMNRAASASAIWHGFRGPNSTIAAGRVAGLMALQYGRRLLTRRRADSVVVSGSEEYSQTRSWLEYHRRPEAPAHDGLGEGSAVLLLERPGSVTGTRTALAEVLAVTSRVATDGDPLGVLESCLSDSLEAAGVSAQDVWAAMPSGYGGAAESEEARLLGKIFGEETVHKPEISSLIGDTSA